MLQVAIKKLHPSAMIPSYAKPGDAGLDLTAVRILSNDSYQVTYGTGLALEIPVDYVGLIFPRSSIRKYELSLTNSVGVIDSGYRGEIQFTFHKNSHSNSIMYEIGDRIGQLVILPYPQVKLVEESNLSETERGEEGFGSSGN